MSKVIIKRYSVIFYGIVFLFLIKNFRKIKKKTDHLRPDLNDIHLYVYSCL